MTTAVQTLIEAFESLSEAERQEAALEIFRRVTISQDDLPEQAFVEVADELFRALDAEEAANGRL